MAAADAREAAVLDLMRARFDHVSAERCLSGPGLINLYNALCELSGEPAAPLTAAQITNPGIEDEDPRAREATAMFCAMLGTIAGNLALTVGARGGIYIAGGIVPKLGDDVRAVGLPGALRGQGSLPWLPGGDPDLCDDPSGAGAAGRGQVDRAIVRPRMRRV